MTTIKKATVTLSVEEAETILSILRDYSAERWNHARRTKSASIREWCETQGRKASDLESQLVTRLYSHSNEAQP